MIRALMPRAFLFDLDMTLVDSSELARWRRGQLWSHVRRNIDRVKAFTPAGTIAPHELPAKLRKLGHRIAIVTTSPEWYAKKLIADFGIAHDALVSHGDTEEHKPDPQPLAAALKALGVSADNAFHIGDDPVDSEAAYHAGVTSIGAGWGVLSFDELSSAAPDILLYKPSLLLKVDDLPSRRYFAELACEEEAATPHQGSRLFCNGNPRRYALGRYFKREDPRHADSALAAQILAFKDDDDPAATFARSLVEFISNLNWQPDVIVPVPPKPGQKRNRFAKLLAVAAKKLPDDIEIAVDGLTCVKAVDEYKQLSAVKRAKAIRGAFKTDQRWNGRVLVLDDVLTTGETISECARTLTAGGAAEVRCVALGRDQQTFSRKVCSECGRSMRVRTNSKTQEKFWGCSGYPDDCKNTESI